jgi:hypothetical protein
VRHAHFVAKDRPGQCMNRANSWPGRHAEEESHMSKHLGGRGLALLCTIVATAPSIGGCTAGVAQGPPDAGKQLALPDLWAGNGNEAAIPQDSGDALVGDDGLVDGDTDAAAFGEASTEAGTSASGADADAGLGGDTTLLEGGGDGEVEGGSDGVADGGSDGAAAETDPISLSTTTLVFAGSCGATPPSKSFTITNASTATATWTATVSGNFSINVSGSTLAAGAAVTVTVWPLPIPQNPSSTQVGSGAIMISSISASGAVFRDSLTLQEFVNACIAPTSLPTRLDFGSVLVGSAVTPVQVCSGAFGPECYPQGGIGPWELGPTTDSNFTVNGAFGSTNGNCFYIGFAPQTVGPHRMTLTWFLQYGPFCSPPLFVVTGTGAALDAGVSDARQLD